uniref:Uncharacterized protein n=1 Tax=Panagrolaimus superbus TaxID=310955 RepID=A0A914Y1E3_9BILA
MGNRTLDFFQYWIYFQWWKDLRAWGSRNIYTPLAKKLAIVWDGFVYVFGGYWMLPVLQFCGRQAKKAGFITLGYLNQLAIIIGNSVLWPVAVIFYDQLKAGYLIFHAAAVQPVIDVVYLKYKYVEDLTYIHVLGPVCQKVIDNVPEKNPFADDSESELQDFIPDASEAASDSEFSTLSAPETDDEEHAFAKGLHKIAISDSESDNEELSLHHRRSRNVKK